MLASSPNPVYTRIPADGVTPFTLTAGNSNRYPAAGCRYFRVLASSGVLHVRFDDGPEIPMRAGMAYRAPVNFSWVTLSNRGGSDITIDVAWADGEITDDAVQLLGSLTGITNPVKTFVGANIIGVTHVSLSAGSVTTFLSASATRRRVTVKNPIANAYPVTLGGSTGPWANIGMQLNPGEQVSFETTGSVSAYNFAPYAQNITCTAEDE